MWWFGITHFCLFSPQKFWKILSSSFTTTNLIYSYGNGPSYCVYAGVSSSFGGFSTSTTAKHKHHSMDLVWRFVPVSNWGEGSFLSSERTESWLTLVQKLYIFTGFVVGRKVGVLFGEQNFTQVFLTIVWYCPLICVRLRRLFRVLNYKVEWLAYTCKIAFFRDQESVIFCISFLTFMSNGEVITE